MRGAWHGGNASIRYACITTGGIATNDIVRWREEVMNQSNKPASINQERSQLINRALILNLLRQEGICSRATLSRLSGLKQATITNIAAELIQCGLVVETGLIPGEKGRRSIGVTLNDARYKVIGISMTRDQFYVDLVGISGKVYETRSFEISQTEGPQSVLSRIRTAILQLQQDYADSELLAACLAMPGPYLEDLDRLLFVTELSGWQNFPIRAVLSEGVGMPIYVLNDAKASAFAQLWSRWQEPAVQNMAYILAGQGVGCGMISDGKLVSGQHGIAGEFGHSSIKFDGPLCECGNHGCLEKYCSLSALRSEIRDLLRAHRPSCLDAGNLHDEAIALAVRAGDPVAVQAYEHVCERLGVGVISLINQMNPGLIVLGDALVDICPERLLEVVRRCVEAGVNERIYSDLAIEINQLEGSPALLGAGAYAAQQVLANPGMLIYEADFRSGRASSEAT